MPCYTFLDKKKAGKRMRLKWPKSQKNRKKIKRLNFQNPVFLLAKNRYFVIIAFKMLKMEVEFEYIRVRKILRNSQAQFREKLKKLGSGKTMFLTKNMYFINTQSIPKRHTLISILQLQKYILQINRVHSDEFSATAIWLTNN